MMNRYKYITIYSIFSLGLILSISLNIIFYNKIITLHKFIKTINPWISVEEFNLIETEIYRLENQKYEIIPQQKFSN